MKLQASTSAALFGLLMMATPSIASATVLRWYPRPVQPVVVAPVVAPAPFAPVALTPAGYYRPLACANPHFRHHHRWKCR